MTKKAMQAVLIAPDVEMRKAILDGTKQITIREGQRDYEVGRQLMVACHLDPWAVLTDITSVNHRTLGEVSRVEWEADGFTSQQDLLEGMRKYYPSLTLDSSVTVICWKNARGQLVDDND